MSDDVSNSLSPEHQELLAGYVLGDLDPEEMIVVQELLRNAPHLEQEVVNLQEALGAIPLALDPQQPPENLKDRILVAADLSTSSVDSATVDSATVDSETIQASQRRSLWKKITWGKIVTGIAVAGAIALGLQNLQLRQQLAQTENQPYKIAVNAVDSDEGLPQETWQSFTEVLQDHQQSVTRDQGPVDFASQDVAAVRSQYSQRIALSDTFPELKKAKLLGGSFCELSKTQGIRLSYKVPGQNTEENMISFYQLNRKGFSLDITETPMPIQVFDGPNGLVWGDRNYVYVLVGEVSMDTIRQLRRSLQSI